MRRLGGRAHRESAGGADCQGASPCVLEVLLFAAPPAAPGNRPKKSGRSFVFERRMWYISCKLDFIPGTHARMYAYACQQVSI